MTVVPLPRGAPGRLLDAEEVAEQLFNGKVSPRWVREELAEVEWKQAADLLGEILEPVRIPYVLPAADSSGAYPDRPTIDEPAAIAPLKAAGILKDYGRRVVIDMQGLMT